MKIQEKLHWLAGLLLFLFLADAAWAVTCTSRTSGNWSSNNTWNCGTGNRNGPPASGDTVVVNNAVTLDVNTPNLASLTVNTGDSITGTAYAINLTGNLTVSGTGAITAGSIALQGDSTWTGTGTGTVSLNYLDLNWKKLVLSSGSTLTISLQNANPIQDIAASSFNYGAPANATATVYLNGTAQAVPTLNIQYPNLRLGGGVKSVQAGILTVLGDIVINSGATLDATTHSNSDSYLAGDLTINGTFNSGDGWWILNGSTAQNISATASFSYLELSNAAGLDAAGNLTIGPSGNGSLKLTAGKVRMGSNTLVVGVSCDWAGWLTRSAGSWVQGKMQLSFPNYPATCTFPIGDANDYAPLTLAHSWHSGNMNGSVSAETVGSDHPDTVSGTSGISASRGVNRYWKLNPVTNGSNFSNFDVTLQYCNGTDGGDCMVNDVDPSANSASFVVAEKVSSTWSTPSSSAVTLSPPDAARKVTAISSFGDFAIGQAGNGCEPPSNVPNGVVVSCQCDSFGRTTLNPSTIFGSNWIPSTSDQTGILPRIVNQGYLRLTENTNNNAKAVTVPGIFPAAGNYISVEFKHYAYNGINNSTYGADGIAVILSDYSKPAVPGAYGGSLGYAQKDVSCSGGTGTCPGFAGGWIGVGIDEYGNYQNPTEGRVNGRGAITNSVAVRGSGSGTTGYAELDGTNSLTPGISNRASTTPAYGYTYQVIVDARSAAAATPSTSVIVNRDTGSGYSNIINISNVFSSAPTSYPQAAVPDNWQISFTGSTGGSTNIHEIGGLKICAQIMAPTTGGIASGFNAIDEDYGNPASAPVAVQSYLTGHIFTKLVGVPFKLDVAAISNNQIVTTYAASGTKSVTVKLVDNTDGVCVLDASQSGYCNSTCTAKSAVSGGSQTLSFASTDKGQKQSANFTLTSAYSNLVAVISDGSTTACSTDSFSVRPTSVSGVTLTASGNPLTFAAGSGQFSLIATVPGFNAIDPIRYNGTLKIANGGISGSPVAGTLSSSVFLAAAPVLNTTDAAATATNLTYSEVGTFLLKGYDPAADTTSTRGIYDDTWTAVDSPATINDCIVGSYSNTKINGKYGCNFGLYVTGSGGPSSPAFGRFIPHHFGVSGAVVPRSDLLTAGSINSGSTSLTVGSASALAVGRQISIQGAGAGGAPLTATVTAIAGTAVTLSAAAGSSVSGATVSPVPSDTFSYMDEPMAVTLTVTAYNAGDSVTQNYAGSSAQLDAATLNASAYAPWLTTGCSGTSQCMGLGAVNGSTPLSSRLAVDTASTGSAVPTSSWSAGVGTFKLFLKLTRGSSADGPYTALNLGAKPRDSDGVTLPPETSTDTAHCADIDVTNGSTSTSCFSASSTEDNLRRRVATIDVRYGRLWLGNAYGSEYLPLKMPMQTQYWNGSAWVQNTADSQTTLKVPVNSVPGVATDGLRFNDSGPRNHLDAGEVITRMGGASPGAATNLTTGNSKVTGGDARLWLTNKDEAVKGPGEGNYGYVDIIGANLGAPTWLPVTGNARACFGACGPRSPVIYFRENY
ncbi:MAG: DUF6701 domain-containing protein [Actinomycetota bacterium]